MSETDNLRTSKFLIVLISFIGLTFFVHGGITNNVDNLITKIFYNIGGLHNTIDVIVIIISSLGDLFVMLIVGLILTIIRRTRRIGLLVLISIVILSVSTMYIKPLVGRPAPLEQYVPKFHVPDKYTIEKDSMMPISRDLSFPSNHAARAAAFIIILGFWSNVQGKRNIVGRILWIFPLAIGFTRLYLLQNYLFDVVGGLLYGIIVGLVLCRLIKLNRMSEMNKFN